MTVDELMKKMKSGSSAKALRWTPNHKNRIWTLCNVTMKMVLLTVEEAEKYGMTDEQFYLAWEDLLNKISIKDHTTNEDSEIQDMFHKFHADSE